MNVLEIGDGYNREYPSGIKTLGDRYNRKYPLGIKTPSLVSWLVSEPKHRKHAAVAKMLLASIHLYADDESHCHGHGRSLTIWYNLSNSIKRIAMEYLMIVSEEQKQMNVNEHVQYLLFS